MMKRSRRRDFLKGSLAAASWAALSTGTVGAFLTTGCAADRKGTRFLEAVVEGSLPVVRTTLDQDPELLHLRDDAGRSAFALAVLNRHDDIRDLLRERGHEPDLHESALAEDWERFDELAEAQPGKVNEDHPLGGTAMHAIALAGTGTSGFRVYSHGGDPNLKPPGRGYSPLRTALDHPDVHAAEMTAAFLLGNGADPNLPEAGDSTPLHAAAARGITSIVETLIRKHAALDARDERGRTPRELAEDNGHRKSAARLERHTEVPRDHSTSRDRYDVNGDPYRAPDLSTFSDARQGKIVGVSHFDIDAVREAVQNEPLLAHSTATTTERAVEACAHTGRIPIVDYLLENGAPYSLPSAVVRNDLKRARALLEEDPLRVNERGPHDFPLLWYPVIGKGLVEMTELLFEHGADAEWQHWMGTTALHYAALGGQSDMIAVLLDHGADVNRVGRKFDPVGQTPLQLAEARERTDAAKLLRARGATG